MYYAIFVENKANGTIELFCDTLYDDLETVQWLVGEINTKSPQFIWAKIQEVPIVSTS